MARMTPANVLDEGTDAASQVEALRLHVLLQAVYPLRVAERLAKSSADLHRAVELVGQGCAPETAVEILL